MSCFAVYDDEGRILSVLEAPLADSLLYKNTIPVKKDLDTEEYYISDRKLEKFPSKPDRYHEWDWAAKQWKFSQKLKDTIFSSEKEAIALQREKLLIESDWTDGVSAKTRLKTAKYDEWQAYRQALRDITSQPGYPETVIWPTKPE